MRMSKSMVPSHPLQFSSGMVQSILLVLFFIGAPVFGKDHGFDAFERSPLKDQNQGSPVHELQNAFQEVYDLYKDSVVFISTEKTVEMPASPFYNDPFFRQFFGTPPEQEGNAPRTRKETGLGTGFVISRDGYICTNHHVIADMDSVTVKISGQEYKARVIGSDPTTDIALLKVDGARNLKPVYFGDSDQVRVGNWAIAIGNPFGLDRTFTVGVISAVARTDLDQLGNSHIQTDASINPGNSGGPLLNIDGEVIGVNRMIYSRSGGNMGIGFAIPMNTAKDILEELRIHGKIRRGYLGVRIAPVDEVAAGKLGVKSASGAIVSSVLPGSPAHDAGIHTNDVIVSVDGDKVSTPEDLIRLIRQKEIGSSVELGILRGGEKRSLKVSIKERP